jgi:hypothetical protein
MRVRTILYRYITVEKYAWPGQIAPTIVADEQSTRYMAVPMALYQCRPLDLQLLDADPDPTYLYFDIDLDPAVDPDPIPTKN